MLRIYPLYKQKVAIMAYSVLLIDDEPHFCSSLKPLLEEDGYTVTLSNSGQESLFHLERTIFDAVLLDLGLPDISGITLAETLRNKYPATVVIVMTGSATIDNAVASLRNGVYDYLKKPFDPDRLLNILARGIEYQTLKQSLANSEKRFRQLACATWEGIIIYDNEKLLQANNQLYEMFGYTEEEIAGSRIFDILFDRDTIKAMHFRDEPKTIGPFEAIAIKKDGRRFPVEIRVKRIDYSGCHAEVAAIRDVTGNRSSLEKQLALQQKLDDARRMETLGLMAGSVAHDLNNILSGIITYPELLLLDLPEDFKYRNEIEMIRDAGKRAAAIVDDLLTLARGAGSKKEVHNLNDLVTKYVHSIECRELYSRYYGLSITSDTDPELANIVCSPLHVTKSLVNLVNNAAEAAGEGGSIRISVKNHLLKEPVHGYETIEPGEYVCLRVEDNGHGIDAKTLPHIFDPFYSKKVLGRSGTGLGLTVVWNSIHDHHGFIDVQSSEQGTGITLYFPVTKQPIAVSLPSHSPHACRGRGERILVVDDQENQREIARRLLLRLGYEVDTVASGEEAVEFVKKQQVELILLDMVMEPGINGCETYQRIVRHRPQQKAVIISGYSNTNEVERARELGINHFIKKPYTLHDLGEILSLEIS